MNRKRIWKNLTSLALAACMAVSTFAASGMSVLGADGFDPNADLLAHYPLEADVADVSGHDNDATITAGATGAL